LKTAWMHKAQIHVDFNIVLLPQKHPILSWGHLKITARFHNNIEILIIMGARVSNIVTDVRAAMRWSFGG